MKEEKWILPKLKKKVKRGSLEQEKRANKEETGGKWKENYGGNRNNGGKINLAKGGKLKREEKMPERKKNS